MIFFWCSFGFVILVVQDCFYIPTSFYVVHTWSPRHKNNLFSKFICFPTKSGIGLMWSWDYTTELDLVTNYSTSYIQFIGTRTTLAQSSTNLGIWRRQLFISVAILLLPVALLTCYKVDKILTTPKLMCQTCCIFTNWISPSEPYVQKVIYHLLESVTLQHIH